MSHLLTTRYLHRAPFELEGIGIELPTVDAEHPNRVPWRGVLTRLDEPSTRPPGGAAGHRVQIPRMLAEQALPSLIAMPVNLSADMSDHDRTKPVGIIQEAHIEGRDLVVSGILFGKNFPAEVQAIKANKHQLGMSYEIGDVEVDAVETDIWTLTNLTFTGAAILFKDKAAYHNTSLAATAEEEPMDKILEQLHTLTAKMDSMQASMDAQAAQDAEADAVEQDVAAARALTAAQRAAADGDREDAARHEESAAQYYTAAFTQRLKASAWHTTQAQQAREAQDETAATEHEAAAERLKAAAEVSQKALTDLRAAQEARDAAAAQDATSQDAGMVDLMTRMVEAMAGTEAKGQTTEPTRMGRLMAAMIKAMTERKVTAAEHDDEEDDKALIRRMMREKGKKDGMMAASDLVLHRRVRNIEAALELLTDGMGRLTGLLTDRQGAARGLVTDRAATSPGGGQAPVRRSIQGAGGQEQWADKYGETRNGAQGKKTEAELTKELIAAGITDTTAQMSRIVQARALGEIA